MITGELIAAAVSITPFIVLLPVQLAAGSAKPLALASAKTSFTSEPVRTPGAKSVRIAVMTTDRSQPPFTRLGPGPTGATVRAR